MIVTLSPNGITLDKGSEKYRNSQEIQVFTLREDSNAAPHALQSPRTVAHLPVVKDKPRAIIARYERANQAKYRRVVVVIGLGKARNKYGASCVAYARSQGFNITGDAYLWPAHAKAAGYAVDHHATIGSIIVTKESSAGTTTGHVTGKIQRIENGYAYVTEQNYKKGMLTAGWISLTKVVGVIHPR